MNTGSRRRITLTAGRPARRSKAASPIQSVYVKGMASPHLRPFMYLGLAGVAMTLVLSRVFGIDRGLIAVLFGGVAVILFVVYTRGTGSRAREEVAGRRDEFYRRLVDSESDDEDA